MKWLYTFAVVTPAWYEAAEGSLCRPRGGLLTARARCFEDHIRNLLDVDGATSLAFLRSILDRRQRTHSRVVNPALSWLAGATPAQQATWERYEREDLLIDKGESPVFLPVPAALAAAAGRPPAVGGEVLDTAAVAFNAALRDALTELEATRAVLILTGRSI